MLSRETLGSSPCKARRNSSGVSGFGIAVSGRRAAADMAQQGDQRRGGHSRYPARGAQGRGARGLQLLPHLVGQGCDPVVVEAGREGQILVAAEGADIGVLALEVAGIAAVDLD